MASATHKRVGFLIAVFIFSFVLMFVSAIQVSAASLTVTPVLIDKKVEQRDIVKGAISVTNNTNNRFTLYAEVTNVDPETGEEIFLDRAEALIDESLANWIEISRGAVDLEGADVVQIPYLIHVSPNAKTGVYHAKVRIFEGGSRDLAEKRPVVGEVLFTVEVKDDAIERLQLGTFKSDKIFFSDKDVTFTYFLENIGNRSVAPEGEIRIFNRRGEEIATLDANNDSASLLPDATSQLGAAWNAAGVFGRFKAMLDVNYGKGQQGAVQDTVYFWVIPWQYLVLLFLVMITTVGTLTYILYRRYTQYHHAFAYHQVELQHFDGTSQAPLGDSWNERLNAQDIRNTTRKSETAHAQPIQNSKLAQTKDTPAIVDALNLNTSVSTKNTDSVPPQRSAQGAVVLKPKASQKKQGAVIRLK